MPGLMASIMKPDWLKAVELSGSIKARHVIIFFNIHNICYNLSCYSEKYMWRSRLNP